MKAKFTKLQDVQKTHVHVFIEFIGLRKMKKKIFDEVACFADVQAFLVHRLSGEFNTGWISSDPHGMFDVVNKCWSKDILEHLNIDESRLPKSFKPGTCIGKVSKDASHQTGLKEGLSIFAAGGDGQLAGLGTNCTKSDFACLMKSYHRLPSESETALLVEIISS